MPAVESAYFNVKLQDILADSFLPNLFAIDRFENSALSPTND
jgi:hypothetical protein